MGQAALHTKRCKASSAFPGVKHSLHGANPSIVVRSTRVGTSVQSRTSAPKGNYDGPTTSGSSSESRTPRNKKLSQFYFNQTGFPFPLGPVFNRNTVRREVEKGTVWVFDQTQALEVFNVYTPVRMTVIKLKSGGLWVHAPVAPTEECLYLLRELNAPVEYIVLPTFAYEHKMYVGPFSREFPKAKVYVTPYQWSFPLNLPPQFFGIFPSGTLDQELSMPWEDEIEHKVFLPPSIGVGNYVRFCEVAFFHKRSQTLMVTDAVIYVPRDPPEVIPRPALLELARDGWLSRFVAGGLTPQEVKEIANPDPVEDTVASRRKGWMRMSLLVLFLGPFNLLQPEESFRAISDKLFVGPVVETLVYNKAPRSVCDWVDSICADWKFKRIIPCHFEAPVRAGPKEFREAFNFAYDILEATSSPEGDERSEPTQLPSWLSWLSPKTTTTKRPRPVTFPEEDMQTLNSINRTLLATGVVKQNADFR